jgi:NTE family protein
MARFKNPDEYPKVGLILTGGGAKAAYQVGVIKAILKILPNDQRNPFPIIAGSSGGAINGTVMASFANRPRVGIRRLENIWTQMHVNHIYRVGWPGLMKNSARWLGQFFRSIHSNPKPLSLFLNSPLSELLNRVINFEQIQKNIDDEFLIAVSVTAFGYGSGVSTSFFQGNQELENWKRHKRAGQRDYIGVNHLMASAAIPIVFPAIKIKREYFGDGSIGFLSPVSPALHMGADKVLVINMEAPNSPVHSIKQVQYPQLAEIGSRLMESIFTDSLAADLERLERVNATLKLIPDKISKKQKNKLKQIDSLVISPGFDIDKLAVEHYLSLPKLLRFFLKRAGISAESGIGLLSYLLFEKSFTTRLVEKGMEETLQRSEEIISFFSQPRKDV